MCLLTLAYFYVNDPGLLQERYGGAFQKGQKAWDKIFLSIFISLFYLSYFVMPLDARRYHWSPAFPFWLETAGAILLSLAFVIIFEAFRENTFAAPVVKIQEERHQTVISTGMYGIVRHPMYLGAMLLFVGVPLLLGSVWGLVLGSVETILIAARSLGEEAELSQNLTGYREYMKRVRWRMIPFIF